MTVHVSYYKALGWLPVDTLQNQPTKAVACKSTVYKCSLLTPFHGKLGHAKNVSADGGGTRDDGENRDGLAFDDPPTILAQN